jgi:divalent metal cation (Fe/Co/Zn/Cd) transporter
MAHVRKPLGIAVALNTAVVGLEVVGGLGSRSFALVADAAHNLSDELALVCLGLAYVLTMSVNRRLQRMANLLNSLGLVAVSAVLAWRPSTASSIHQQWPAGCRSPSAWLRPPGTGVWHASFSDGGTRTRP